MFVAALMGSAVLKSSPQDLWGNVKIPRIESYEGTVPMDDEGWYKTKSGDLNAYSSLIGIPIADVNNSAYIEYTTRIQTPYLGTKCPLTVFTTDPSSSSKSMLGISSNFSGSGSRIFWNVPNIGKQNSTTSRDQTLPEKALPLRIKYVPFYTTPITFDCNATSAYVETEILCPTPTNCTATRVRRSQLGHYPTAWTLLDLSWRTIPLTLEGMLKDQGKLRQPQLVDRYMVDPSMIFLSNLSESFPQTSEENYTIRFGQMLNTFFPSLNGISAVTAGINDETAYFWDNNHTFVLQPSDSSRTTWGDLWVSTSKEGMKTKAWSSEGTKVERTQVILAHRIWIIALCVASSVLIASSFVNPFVHYFFSTGVDVAMNISSLATRHNPHIPLPATGTYLDASDRARLLSRLKVRLGDADSSTDIGSLAIGSFNTVESTGIVQVRKGRMYE